METKQDKNENLKKVNAEKESSVSKKIYSKVFVMIIISLILFEYYIYCFEIKFKNFTSKNLNYELFSIFIFHTLLFLMIWSLLITMNTHPGEIPLYWGFYIGDEDSKRKKYCLICNAFKPERSHHCSVCNICVLNMDHHCQWVNNCIGFYNRKFFMQLLFYLFLLTIYIQVTEFREVYKIGLEFYYLKLQYKEAFRALIILSGFLIIFVISGLIFFFFKFHLKLVLNNITTIEALDSIVWIENKFKLNKSENWLQVFGENKLLWFFPIISESGNPKGDGLVWKTNEKEMIDNCTMNPNNDTVAVKIKQNYEFNNANTPVNYPKLSVFPNRNPSPLDLKSNITNLNVNLEKSSNKINYESNKQVNDMNSTKAFFSPTGHNFFFSNDTKNFNLKN